MRIDIPRVNGGSTVTTIVHATGAIAIVIGLAVIVSWHAQFEPLLRIRSGYETMMYNTAVGLALSGLAVLLFVYKRIVLARVAASFAALGGILTFAEHLFTIDLGIDRLLYDPYLVAETTTPGRMAPQAAVGLAIAAIALLLATKRPPFRYQSVTLAIAGSLVTSLGAVAFVGYATGFEQAYGWGQLTKMSAQASVGFLALGVAIFALGWREFQATSPHAPRWLFVPVTIGVAAMSILFCQSLLNYENRQIRFSAQTEAAAIQQEVESEISASVASIDRIARRWEHSGRPAQARWEADVNLNFDGPSLYRAIEWIDPFYEAKWVVPPAANARDIGIDARETPELLNVLAIARSERQTIISQPFDRGRGGLEVVAARAIYVDGMFDGFVVAVYRVDQLFDVVLNDKVSPTSSITVSDGRNVIYERTIGSSDGGRNWEVELPAVVRNAQWTLHIWPGDIDPQQSLMPYGALVIGLMMAGLLGLVTWLLQQAGERARAIQLANETLQVEVIERTRAETELRQSTGALERSNRSLQEFAYVASHDLKAPLVSLQGLAAMLQEDIGPNLTDDTRLYLDRIVANATKMRNLLDDLLELSRVGREDAPLSAVDLGNVIEGVSGQLRQMLDQRNGQVIVRGDLPVVAGNPVRLQQVFSNLIDNAVKYTPTDRAPVIEISARERHDTWQITVSDNGTGIPVEHRDKIFTMFQRLPKGRSMNPTGTGMGLAIISRIVEANGGRCWISDSDENGTTFCLTFPKTTDEQMNSTPRTLELVGVS